MTPSLDIEAAGRVLIAIGHGFAVQNARYPDLDSAVARELLSQAAPASRLSG